LTMAMTGVSGDPTAVQLGRACRESGRRLPKFHGQELAGQTRMEGIHA